MSDLREQLANRLANVGGGTICVGENDFGAHAFRENLEKWLALADECIRQMEWARRKCARPRRDDHKDPSMPSAVFHIPGTYVDLTLAPEDWKP